MSYSIVTIVPGHCLAMLNVRTSTGTDNTNFESHTYMGMALERVKSMA